MKKLAGTQIKNPTNFSIEQYNLTKSGRTANGTMTMDIIAKKLKFLFEYSVLSGPDLKVIYDIVFGDEPFFTFEWEENGEAKSCMVYAGAIHYNEFRTDGIWYWKDVKFDLIEQ
jgi:hypothetical protein